MTSFIELPRVAFAGRDQASLYVNVADIVSLEEEWDGQTLVEIRHRGSEGNTARVRTYVPLGALLNLLGELARTPAVRSWTDETKQGWREPIVAALQVAAEKERAGH
jgi:hypothetical protein